MVQGRQSWKSCFLGVEPPQSRPGCQVQTNPGRMRVELGHAGGERLELIGDGQVLPVEARQRCQLPRREGSHEGRVIRVVLVVEPHADELRRDVGNWDTSFVRPLGFGIGQESQELSDPVADHVRRGRGRVHPE